MRVEVPANRAFLTSDWQFSGLRTHVLVAAQRRGLRSGRPRAAGGRSLGGEGKKAGDGSESRGPGAARTDSLSRFQHNATVACLIEACGRSTRLRSPWLAPT